MMIDGLFYYNAMWGAYRAEMAAGLKGKSLSKKQAAIKDRVTRLCAQVGMMDGQSGGREGLAEHTEIVWKRPDEARPHVVKA